MGNERREVRRFGLGMMLLFWALLLGLGTWWLQGMLERRENPNAHLVNVEAGETLTLERNASGHFVATGRINGEPEPSCWIPAPPSWRCPALWPSDSTWSVRARPGSPRPMVGREAI